MIKTLILSGVFFLSVAVSGAVDPEAVAIAEAWEGIYDAKIACQEAFASDDLCKEVSTLVDFSTITITRKGLYLMFSKSGQDWPFYGFIVMPSKDGSTMAGTTPTNNGSIELQVKREPNSGELSGWIRDARFPADLKIVATPRKLDVKIPLSRLYARKLAGDPLTVNEVAGNYSGTAYGTEARVILKDSALSTEALLLSASFIRKKDNTIEDFEEVSLDPIRGLVVLVQFDRGLPNRKWVLAFRRDDLNFQPSLVGTAINLRRPSAYDVNVVKN